ncbi:MAG TPA: 30S ribosomal protein S13, partial [Flavobacterium sp.]|nr:30S ribosomal protein S13 [Flavobacterium sp.]
MARIAGVDIPKNKRGVIALTYIFGLGKSRAIEILEKAQVSQDKKVQDWNDDEIGAIREAVSSFKIEGELRSEVSLNIKRLMDIGCYRGIRHRSGLPLR